MAISRENFKIMPMDLGIGPYSRIFLQIFIIYLAIIKNIKIPKWYFLIASIGGFLIMRRIVFLNSNNPTYLKIHNRNTLVQLPIFGEAMASFILNLSAFLFLILKR